MYLLPAFAEDRLEVKHGLIHAYPLGMLITQGADGADANLLPFLLYADEGGQGMLRAHVARANPVWQALEQDSRCLVTFQGPEAYISPSWYEAKQTTHKVVPTWNYAMVQVRGKARVVHDDNWMHRLLTDLTARHEESMPKPWLLTDAPTDFIQTISCTLVGIELPISSIVGKWKVSQNRSAADKTMIAAGLRERDGEAMAGLVDEHLKPD